MIVTEMIFTKLILIYSFCKGLLHQISYKFDNIVIDTMSQMDTTIQSPNLAS